MVFKIPDRANSGRNAALLKNRRARGVWTVTLNFMPYDVSRIAWFHRHRDGVMLIVKRQVGESVVIDDNIVVTVISQRGNTVQLGIEAPRETVVLRQELKHAKDIDSTPQSVASTFLKEV